VKGNASGGRGAAPDPAGGNDFPRTPSVWVPAARINKEQRSAAQSPGPGPARPWRVWAEPTCDQIGFDKIRIAAAPSAPDRKNDARLFWGSLAEAGMKTGGKQHLPNFESIV
jgi:hypothetical protein